MISCHCPISRKNEKRNFIEEPIILTFLTAESQK